MQAGLSQSDLVAGLQSYSARAWRNGNRRAISLNACSVRASIVTKTILARIGSAGDVSVVSGYAQVGHSAAFGESHMVRPDQTIAAVANFATAA